MKGYPMIVVIGMGYLITEYHERDLNYGLFHTFSGYVVTALFLLIFLALTG
jgi:hypothetical protein